MWKFSLCLVLAGWLFSSAGSVLAANFKAESGVQQNLLLELYTSQGCSSCPPADDWLSELKQDPRLWKTIFPVAFHVDYWNYIGWNDPFSTERYSNRQRRYASSGNVSSVYTPGFIANGREWRSWFRRRDINTAISDIQSNPGKLSLSLDEQQLHVSFKPSIEVPKKLVLNAAWLSMNIKTEVLNGENGGKTLRHDFVCRDWQVIEAKLENGHYQWQQAIDSQRLNKADALVVWVSTADNPAPIQSSGLQLK